MLKSIAKLFDFEYNLPMSKMYKKGAAHHKRVIRKGKTALISKNVLKSTGSCSILALDVQKR